MKNKVLCFAFLCFSFLSCNSNSTAYENYLKQNLKDPESLVIYNEKTVLDEAGVIVLKVDYGAKNSYGGMVRETYYFRIIDGRVVDAKNESDYNNAEMSRYKL